MPISDEIRQAIRERAQYVCEYCHSPERLSANRFTVDYVIPRSLGASNDLDNLAIACRRCNERRYNFVSGFDPETQTNRITDIKLFPILVGKTRIERILMIGYRCCNSSQQNGNDEIIRRGFLVLTPTCGQF